MVEKVEDTGNKFEKLEQFERMLQEKVRGAFTACLAPIPNCTSTVGNVDETDVFKMEGDFETARSKQQEALRRMEAGIKKMSNMALGTEYPVDDEEDPCSDGSSESECLNTIGEETLANIENKRVELTAKGSAAVQGSAVKHLPGSYKQSARSKFDYYRKHRTFGGGALRPISENINEQETSSSEANGSSKTTSTTSTPAAANTVPRKALDLALSPLTTQEQGTEETKLSLPSPASKRNLLAKQILRRRQHQPSQLRVLVEP
jgi:hypothetical protein